MPHTASPTRRAARRRRRHRSQVDFLSPRGAAWAVVGDSVERNHTVQNIERLLQAATRAGMVVAVSPHFYYPTDHRWGFGGPLEALMERVGGSPQPAALTADTPAAGDDVMPQYKKYLLEGKTFIAPWRTPCGARTRP